MKQFGSDFARPARPALRFPLKWCVTVLLVVSAVVILIEKYPPWSGAASGGPAHLTGVDRYFHLHQWSADARTLLAMARYVIEPEGGGASQPRSNRFSPLLVSTNRESPRASA